MTTYFDWDTVEDNIVEEFDDAGTTVADYTTEPYLYGDLVSQRRSGQSRHYHFDGLGSTTELTDGDGTTTDTRSYSAFGQVVESSGSLQCPFEFHGRSRAITESVLRTIYVAAKWYDPATARILALSPSTADTRQFGPLPIVVATGQATSHFRSTSADTSYTEVTRAEIENVVEQVDEIHRGARRIWEAIGTIRCPDGTCFRANTTIAITVSALSPIRVGPFASTCQGVAWGIAQAAQSYVDKALKRRFPRKYRFFGCAICTSCGEFTEVPVTTPTIPVTARTVTGFPCYVIVAIAAKVSVSAAAACCGPYWASDPRRDGLPLPFPVEEDESPG